mmetsp:Transcript_106920/g.340574  ORF Transcript_106920/g.340574 Transcript_106920/m.340574 type:complete len:363 (+) Transcript_106920:158-1246(+)
MEKPLLQALKGSLQPPITWALACCRAAFRRAVFAMDMMQPTWAMSPRRRSTVMRQPLRMSTMAASSVIGRVRRCATAAAAMRRDCSEKGFPGRQGWAEALRRAGAGTGGGGGGRPPQRKASKESACAWEVSLQTATAAASICATWASTLLPIASACFSALFGGVSESSKPPSSEPAPAARGLLLLPPTVEQALENRELSSSPDTSEPTPVSLTDSSSSTATSQFFAWTWGRTSAGKSSFSFNVGAELERGRAASLSTSRGTFTKVFLTTLVLRISRASSARPAGSWLGGSGLGGSGRCGSFAGFWRQTGRGPSAAFKSTLAAGSLRHGGRRAVFFWLVFTIAEGRRGSSVVDIVLRRSAARI